MTLIKIQQNAIPIGIGEDGDLKWAPAIRFGDDEDFTPISRQGSIVLCETKNEALKYFED